MWLYGQRRFKGSCRGAAFSFRGGDRTKSDWGAPGPAPIPGLRPLVYPIKAPPHTHVPDSMLAALQPTLHTAGKSNILTPYLVPKPGISWPLLDPGLGGAGDPAIAHLLLHFKLHPVLNPTSLQPC